MRLARKNIQILAASLLLLFLASCSGRRQFSSDWPQGVERVWIGPQFWANPLQDWRLRDGRVECFVSGGERNVVWLTKELSQQPQPFEMQIELGRLQNGQPPGRGWVGFRVGLRGEFDDYRSAAVRGEGFPAGISSDGILFAGTVIDSAHRLPDAPDHMIMQFEARPVGGLYQIRLTIRDSLQNKLASLTADDIDPDWLRGLAAIVCSSGPIPETPPRRAEITYPDWGSRPGTARRGNMTFWFMNWMLRGEKVIDRPERAFGPVLFAQYTLSRNILKLTAQFPPLGQQDNQTARLELLQDGKWIKVADQAIDADARTATFRIPDWPGDRDVPYRVACEWAVAPDKRRTGLLQGTIRREPTGKDEIVVAAFTGNNDLGFPNNELVRAVRHHDPDLLFFSGDQIYEGVGGYGTERQPEERAILDYLRKWYLYGWAYGNLLKDRPSVAIPDDHDVYHGNIWGAGGIATPPGLWGAAAQDAGGYKMPPRWVNMVQRTQTSHLPDPVDPEPVAQGIGVYFTDMNYAGISFAILEDRKFKSAPGPLLPQARVDNGWAQNPDFDAARQADADGARLLGNRQLAFLEKWSADWSHQTWMKVVLSQTIFANVATLPEKASMHDRIVPQLRILPEGDYPPDDIPVSDMDSNGWPQTPRNKALKIIRKAFAFHIAGDQHLGSLIQYGIDDWHDAGFAFCVPAISNVWPRRWYPNTPGRHPLSGAPKYTGDFFDGFGNRMTVLAVSNPTFTGKKPARLYDRATGYGIIRFRRSKREITVECWPRWVDPSVSAARQYPGWPVTIGQRRNYDARPLGFLPEIQVTGLDNPVVQLVNEKENSVTYTLRITGSSFRPPVFVEGRYTLRVGEPDRDIWKVFPGLVPEQEAEITILKVDFER